MVTRVNALSGSPVAGWRRARAAAGENAGREDDVLEVGDFVGRNAGGDAVGQHFDPGTTHLDGLDIDRGDIRIPVRVELAAEADDRQVVGDGDPGLNTGTGYVFIA